MNEQQDNQPNDKEEPCKCTGKCKKYPYHDSSDKYYKQWSSSDYYNITYRPESNDCQSHIKRNGLLYAIGALLLLLNWDTIVHSVTNIGDWFAIERNNIALLLSLVVFYLLTKRKS